MSTAKYGHSFQYFENYFKATEHSSNPERFSYAIVKFFYQGTEPEFEEAGDCLLWDLIRPSVAHSRNQAHRNQPGPPKGSRNNPKGRPPKTNPKTNPRTNPETKQIEIEVEIEKDMEIEKELSPVLISEGDATANHQSSSNKFIPPSIQEVSDYCASRNNDVDAVKFVNYYESIGWYVGKARIKMKNWKAAVRNWERNQQVSSPNDTGQPQRREGRTLCTEDLL